MLFLFHQNGLLPSISNLSTALRPEKKTQLLKRLFAEVVLQTMYILPDYLVRKIEQSEKSR